MTQLRVVAAKLPNFSIQEGKHHATGFTVEYNEIVAQQDILVTHGDSVCGVIIINLAGDKMASCDGSHRIITEAI